jgi:DNA-binding NarL/FixJ family response regulator
MTSREWEIAQRITDGFDNAEIAERLFLSRATVATHVAKILKKLRHKSRVQVAVWVTERRLRNSKRSRA